MTTRQPTPVLVDTVTAPDGETNVLLQLQDGYIVMRPGDAREVAARLLEEADLAELSL